MITKQNNENYNLSKKNHNKSRMAIIYKFPYKVRQYLYDNINNHLKNKKFKGIILALATGVKHNILFKHLDVYNNMGLAHLLSISGLHIGFVAGLAFIIFSFIWRLMPIRCLIFPAPIIAGLLLPLL